MHVYVRLNSLTTIGKVIRNAYDEDSKISMERNYSLCKWNSCDFDLLLFKCVVFLLLAVVTFFGLIKFYVGNLFIDVGFVAVFLTCVNAAACVRVFAKTLFSYALRMLSLNAFSICI